MDYLTLLAAIAPTFAVLACGAGLRALGKMHASADATLFTVAVNFLYPCFIADVLLSGDAVRDWRNAGIAPLAGIATLLIGFAVAALVAFALRLKSPQPARTLVFSAAIPNWGYLAIPTIQSLFPAAAKDTLGVLFVYNIGLELTLWSLGVWLLAGHGSWRRAFNVPFFAILGSLVLGFTGARDWLPGWSLASLHFLGQAALPLSLLLTGATLADQAREKNAPSGWLPATAGVIVKLALIPPLLLLLARWLPCSVELKRVIIVQAAMPCAMVPVLLARHYGGDAGLALRIVLSTTLIGLLTVPLWLHAGMKFVLGH